MSEVRGIQRRFRVIGRAEELGKALAAVKAGKHLLIEGPVGVGKTVLALAVTKYLQRPFFRVDGDERYSEQKLTGWFDPPIVMKKGYVKKAFIPGPLVTAMWKGGVLFINELNRMPEGVQNVLLPAMDEKHVEIPKIGTVKAEEGFLIIATQNPREFIATSSLSEALRDRFELVVLNYQSEDEEIEIVKQGTEIEDGALVQLAVKVVRKTRDHPEIRRGASVRAAMSIAALATEMAIDYKEAIREAAHMALPTRIELREDAKDEVHKVIDEILDSCLAEANTKSLRLSSEDCLVSPNSSSLMEIEVSRNDSMADLFLKLDEFLQLKPAAIKKDDIGETIFYNYHQIKSFLKDGKLLKLAKEMAVRAIILKSLRLLGPTKMPTKRKKKPYAFASEDEIDLEGTLEKILEKKHYDATDLVMDSKEPKKIACALMVDSSLSMAGEKLIMATASMAVLAYQLRIIDYALITFESKAKLLKRLSQKVAVSEVLEELLDVDASGYTNIEDALKMGLEELKNSRIGDRVGLILTDGNYTTGRNPLDIAAQYPKLFVIMVTGYSSKLELCDEMAKKGKGRLFTAESPDEIPKVIYKVLRAITSKQ